MRYPESLKKGDVIGICAPSGGITEESKLKKLDVAINNLKELGFRVKETESVRKEEKGRSSSGKQRAKELMELLKDDEVKLILCACGGDFLLEMLDYLDLEEIRKLTPKWIQGYSDITGLGFLWNEYLDIPSIYCDTIKSYAMKPLYRNLQDALLLTEGKTVEQESFEKCEKVIDFREELESDLANDSNLEKEEANDIRGRRLI